MREVLSAARDRKVELHVLNARSESDFDAVFADIKRLRVGGLVISAGSIFLGGINKLDGYAARPSEVVDLYWDQVDFRGWALGEPFFARRPEAVSVGHEDHGGIPVPPAVSSGGVQEALDLRLGQVLPRSKFTVWPPFRSGCRSFRSDCSIYGVHVCFCSRYWV